MTRNIAHSASPKTELPHRSPLKTTAILLSSCTLLLAGAYTASASPGGPGVEPPSPTVGEFTSNSSEPLTGHEQRFEQAKQELVDGKLGGTAALAAKAMGVAPQYTATTSSTSNNLSVQYMTQINSSWCGPATVAMIAGYLGVGWSGTPAAQQNAAAGLLGTTMAAGTAWYGADNVPSFPYGSWYPVADTLDYQIYQAVGTTWYTAADVSGTPTASQNSDYVSDLIFDINYSHPIALNQYSIPGYQLPYQPNGTWYHWLVARGFSNSGATTVVNDPGWTAGDNATAPSTSGAHSVTYAIGARGYIW